MLYPAHAAGYIYGCGIGTGFALLAGVTTPIATFLFWRNRTLVHFITSYHRLAE